MQNWSQVSQVLPLEKLIRETWSSSAFLRGCVDVSKPFLLADDGSKAHLQRLNSLMGSNFDWVLMRIICLLAQEAEVIGSWCEGCPCHVPIGPHISTQESQEHEDGFGIVSVPLPSADDNKRKRSKRRTPALMQAYRESKNCSFRCCRAPELAVGCGLARQREFTANHQGEFTEAISKLPNRQRGELIASWTFASAKLFGYLAAKCFGFFSNWLIGRLVHYMLVTIFVLVPPPLQQSRHH